jgi:hypothetical protein
MRHRLEALAHVAVLLAAVLACKGGSNGSSSDNTAGPGAAPAPAEAATPVQAAVLIADYKGNEVRGDGKWKGKLVKVSGFAGDIKKDILDKPFVTVGTGSEFEIPTVQCSLAAGQEGAAASLSKGQSVTLKGRVKGLMMNVQLDDCEVVPAQAAPPAAPQPAPRPAAPAPRKR